MVLLNGPNLGMMQLANQNWWFQRDANKKDNIDLLSAFTKQT